MLDLDRRVLEPEPLVQKLFELTADPMAVLLPGDEVSAAKTGTDRACSIAELCMVEEVKVLPAEIEAGFFIDGEPFEDAEIEVNTPGQV